MAKKVLDNIDKDSIQCMKDGFGVHYGRWKAAQVPVKVEPKKSKIGIETSICAYCGCEFIPSDNRNRKYCGARCRKLRNLECATEKYYRQKTQTEE